MLMTMPTSQPSPMPTPLPTPETPPAKADVLARYPALVQNIGGDRVAGGGRRTGTVVDPATGAPIAEFPIPTPADLDQALRRAAEGFAVWRKTSAHDRGRALIRTAQLMRERRFALAALSALELGKPWREAVAEVEQAAGMFEWAGEEGKRAYGRVIPARETTTRQMALVEPVGPVAAFSSWNAPLITPSRKLSGALGAGCSVILKAAEETPACALAIADILEEAGVPAGVVSVVYGDPALISETLLASPVIRAITFTGSTAIGAMLGQKAMAGMKRPILELGGHAPVLVFDDVDIETVVAGAVATKFRNAGQVCVSPTRFFVQKAIYADFVDAFAARMSTLRLGDPLAAETTMGPLAHERRRQAIDGLVADARGRGLRVIAGGDLPGADGFFYRPTALVDVTTEAQVANTEPFGPIAAIAPFETLEEALGLANRLPIGLASYVMTDSLRTAHAAADGIEAGSVIINGWRVSLPETPFGGVKDSGMGREGGIEGLSAFQNVKYVSQS